MLRYILLLILLSSLASATTETIDLKVGDSFLIRDKNITLINADDDDEKIVVCVNNIKSIVNIDENKWVNNVYFDIKNVDKNIARIKIERDCKNCICDNSCNNDLCFDKESLNENLETKEEIKEDNKEILIRKEITQADYRLSLIGIFIILAVIIFLILRFKK